MKTGRGAGVSPSASTCEVTTRPRQFRVIGEGSPALVLNHTAAKPENVKPEVAEFFVDLDVSGGDSLVAFGWASREGLAKLL